MTGMPDILEIYELVTKQRPPDPGALERQRRRQIRTARNRKVGAIAVAAAIGAVAVAVVLAARQGDLGERTTGSSTEREAIRIATDFLEAYGSLDADRTVSYLADDAGVGSMIAWVGTQGAEGPVEGFRLLFSLLEAQRYELVLGPCAVLGGSTRIVTVHCPYEFHSLGSHEIGRGPFGGSSFRLVVRDGAIVSVAQHMEAGEGYSDQAWEPFERWVSRNHPEDAAVMYRNDDHTLERVTEKSIRLWDRHVAGYVEHVLRTEGSG